MENTEMTSIPGNEVTTYEADGRTIAASLNITEDDRFIFYHSLIHYVPNREQYGLAIPQSPEALAEVLLRSGSDRIRVSAKGNLVFLTRPDVPSSWTPVPYGECETLRLAFEAAGIEYIYEPMRKRRREDALGITDLTERIAAARTEKRRLEAELAATEASLREMEEQLQVAQRSYDRGAWS
jgi:uncharacterized small protein (DUF1192 family)